jgi:hypothetical protein
MADDADKRIEEQTEKTGTKASEAVVTEANAGKTALVEKQKELTDYLKGGGTSGITNEFGKPILIEDLTTIAKKVGETAAEALSKIMTEGEKESGTAAEKEPESTAKESGEAKTGKPSEPGVIEMKPEVITAKPPYSGEGVKSEVEPSVVTGQRGDTLDKIAKANLPADATKEDVKAYAKEIAVVNGLDPKKPGDLENKELKLPGHTKDGGFVTEDDNFRRTTRWKDGNEKIEDPSSGIGYARKREADGSYKENHWGPQKEDNFELTHTADGKVLIADKAGDTPREVTPASEEVKTERQKLNDLADEKIKDPQKRAKFEADMLRFEERAAKQTPPLSPEEVAKTYKETERLLEATGDTPLKPEDRVKLAEQVMSQAADPKSIDQGQHETCNVTTGEAMMYTKHPSDAIKLVTDVATTGEYTAPDGTKVKVDPTAADGEAKENPPADGNRSHASQIYQVTAVNLYYQKQPYTYTDAAGNPKTVPAGQIEYQQVPDQPGAIPPVVGGERLIDKSTTPPTTIMSDWAAGTPKDNPDLADRAMVDIPNIISGTNDAVMIEHEKAVYGDKTGVDTFKSEEEMKDYIKKAKEDGKMPIIVGVHTGQEPFLHDSGGGAAGGSGGWHVVTITDYDEATGKVKIDNQWGSSADHQGDNGVHVHDLYRASRKPSETETEEAPWYKPWEDDKEVNVTIRDLQKDVDYNRENDKVDGQKELELLRLKNKHGGMSDADYDAELKKTIDESAARWEEQKADGTFDQAEYDNAQAKLKDMVTAMPPERKVDFIKQMHDKGMTTDADYKEQLSENTRKFFDDTHTDAENDAYMTKLKGMTDALPEAERDGFYQELNDWSSADTRLELLQHEQKAGVISDAKYDDQIASTTTEYASETHTAAESAAYTARLWTMLNALPEDRKNAVLAKITAAAGP